MSNRLAKNIEYNLFLTSFRDELESVACPKLEIPEFQRNYVWKINNIKDIFDSIKDNGLNYYLGNIVIVKDGSGRSKIVDGQQRLVSLSLFAKVLMTKTSNEESKVKLNNIIWAERGVLRILFKKQNLNNVYEKILNGLPIDRNELDEVQKILFDSFSSINRELFNLTDVDGFIDNFLSLEFVVIVSPSDDDAYQLFEGLNSTGLSLSAVELTKNSILGKIKFLESSKIEEGVKIWTAIEKNFEDSRIFWFNKFLRHHWFSKKGYSSNSNLFHNIKKEIINKSGIVVDDLFCYLKELEEYSYIYVALRNANLNKADFNLSMHVTSWECINELTYFIKELELDQIYSVLLALYKYGKNEHEYFKRGDTFQKHIQKIWKFLLIVKYSKVSPSSFEKKFSDVCIDIQGKNYQDFKEVMNSFFKSLSKDVEGLQDDFSVSLEASIDYSVGSKSAIKYILEEYLLIKGEGSDTDLETEHIIPENNLDEWPHIIDKSGLKNFIGKLGNLTLLKDVLNKDADNKSFNEKFDIAYSKSRFTVNNKLKDEWGDKFNSTDPLNLAVIPRGLEIGRVIYDEYIKQLSS